MTTWQIKMCDWCKVAVPIEASDTEGLEAWAVNHNHEGDDDSDLS